MCDSANRGFGETIQDLPPLGDGFAQELDAFAARFAAMTEAEILKDFERYDFRDTHGHPLTHVIDFMALVRLAARNRAI